MNKKGFTLIELLVVVLIIGVLSAVALPGYRKAMEKAKAAEAIQTLSDISKAQHNHYLTSNRYTNDFSDLVLTMKDKNTLSDADHSSYATEHFVYNLDNNQDLATASRDKGADSYTLYRFYEDPITYCQPKGNKYCEALDLPAGTFTHSIGAWQSCEGGVYPCTKSCARSTAIGYNCTGTYNEDGSFNEKVCFMVSNGQMSCELSYYDDNGNILRRLACEVGSGLTCNKGQLRTFDEKGNILSSISCYRINSDGTCESRGTGYFFYYDEDGNRTHISICGQYDINGNCTDYLAFPRQTQNPEEFYDKVFDDKGNVISTEFCDEVDRSSGNCTRYDGMKTTYTYDNGKLITETTCDYYGCNPTWKYEYDGDKVTAKLHCDGRSCDYYGTGEYYTYDDKGNLLYKRECRTNYIDPQGKCWEFNGGGTVYTYNDNGKVIYETKCNDIDSEGNCNASSSRYEYSYDDNGNMTGKRNCTTISGDGTCSKYDTRDYSIIDGLNYEFVYDENGNRIQSRRCTSYSGSTCTNWTNYSYDIL